jgi:hypothetical protein
VRWYARAGCPGGSYLLHQEGVSARTGVHIINHRWRGPAAKDLGKQLSDRGRIEAVELNNLRERQPRHLGEERSKRMAPGDVIGPIRAHDQQRHLARGAHRVHQQVSGRGVRPVQILHNHYDWTFVAQGFQQLQESALNPTR